MFYLIRLFPAFRYKACSFWILARSYDVNNIVRVFARRALLCARARDVSDVLLRALLRIPLRVFARDVSNVFTLLRAVMARSLRSHYLGFQHTLS